MKKQKSAFIILGALLFLNILAWIAAFELSRPGYLEVNFFDVGQGDSIFIETPSQHQILIDGGPNSKVLEKLGDNMPFWDRSIDLVILTHPDRDHLTGLLDVLRKYEIDNILWTGVIKNNTEHKEWRSLLEKEEAQITITKAGQKIKSGKVIINILFPFENLENQELTRVNDTSVVARLDFKENNFLFTGDISKSVEKEIIKLGIDIDSDVLKVAHHGSSVSTSEDFLEKVSPQMAVISVGENKYGHPTLKVLEQLEFFGIKTLRTDLVGDIKIISDGEKLKYETTASNF